MTFFVRCEPWSRLVGGRFGTPTSTGPKVVVTEQISPKVVIIDILVFGLIYGMSPSLLSGAFNIRIVAEYSKACVYTCLHLPILLN